MLSAFEFEFRTDIEYGAETDVKETAFAGNAPPVKKSVSKPPMLAIVLEMLNRNFWIPTSTLKLFGG